MHTTRTAASLAFSALLAIPAAAQPTTLTVDPGQSTISLEIEVQSSFGNRDDSDATTVSGTVTIELDSYAGLGTPGAPTAITISGFAFAADSDLSFSFDYGFFGSVNATTDSLALGFPAGEAPVTGTVDPATGVFTVAGVPSLASGTITAVGTGLVGAALGTTVIDLPALGTSTIDVTGTVDVANGTVTASVSTPIAATDTPADGITVVVTGSADAVATGPVPDPACPADINGDGIADGSDFFAWVAAFGTQDPAADVNGDGAVDGSDFFAWVAAFGQGC